MEASYMSLFGAIFFFFSRILHKHFKIPRNRLRKVSSSLHAPHLLQKYPSFLGSEKPLISTSSSIDDQTLIFNVEETLLKSSSLFPYFMLVAFEAGSPLRAFLLLALYPFICLLHKETALKIMVFISLFGIKKEGFMVGRSVLPKYFLEDVGLEGFEVVTKCRTKVGVSQLPQVMIESFLKEYLNVDYVVGKELKVFCGYYMGVMEDNIQDFNIVKGNLKEDGILLSSNVIGICGSKASLTHPLFAFCKVSHSKHINFQ